MKRDHDIKTEKKIVALRANYDEQTWDKGIDCSVDPLTGECLPSLTQQQFKDDCDIQKIIDRFARTGELPDMIKREPQYGDFSTLPDFQDAMEIVVKAQEQFESLDAPIRKRFNNDPAQFLEFATNPNNGEEMVKMGLATARPPKSSDVDTSTASTPSAKADDQPGGVSSPTGKQTAKAVR